MIFMKAYETFEHEADIGIRGFGKTPEEAFANGARAMFSIMVDLRRVNPVEKIAIKCDAGDVKALFVEFLNSLLSQIDLSGMVFSKFKVKIEGNKVKAFAYGEPLNKEKHKVKTEVKAATYCMMDVYEDRGKWTAHATTTTPSTALIALVTWPPKSTCPGVSIRLIKWSCPSNG